MRFFPPPAVYGCSASINATPRVKAAPRRPYPTLPCPASL